MSKPVYKTFLVKNPCHAMLDGITGHPELGVPEFELAAKQHEDYVDAIKSLNVNVIELAKDERYPDSCFVEDPVVIIPNELAIITNPGASSRNGEKLEMIKTIKALKEEGYFKDIKYIEEYSPEAFMDGGDVLPIDDTYYIGLSARTNAKAIEAFESYVKPLGKTVVPIPVTEFLHLKTGTTYIENNYLLVTGEFCKTPEFQKFNLIEVPKEEDYAVNVIYCNGNIIMPAGYPTVKAKLEEIMAKHPDQYLSIVEVDTSEYKKIDGGLTCLSVRF
ncbi:N(G),N(G)-dimethylarginine dimethylaminohydrolase [[Mycoplasma] falconis]|uniref:N(G),N(G)-dimethylarginine dimethylaminohydrolase n=1 Tax=[Mycoplasma] falconis TaxID=92403 RepID=A0A501X8G9_9BACT|nr:arginine deiminase family protein [[Mycoplasma] falconis]TPE56709.1 N(G),N(G)-dimethylarginine dimethylaminohydrolase [[Mycoplasma] falconis]